MHNLSKSIAALAAAFAITQIPAFAGPHISCINSPIAALPNLVAAAQSNGLTAADALPDAAPDGSAVVWEVTADQAATIDAKRAGVLADYVRHGGALFLTIGDNPGGGPFRLSFMLPTTAWETQIRAGYRGGPEGAISTSTVDASFFNAATANVKLSYHFRIRPVEAEERGEEKYERFARGIPYIGEDAAAGDPLWTRPLINRDWQVRIDGNDVGQTPLLVTGRYGAGRVAVLAGSITDLDSSPDGRAVEAATIKWLTDRTDTAAAEADGALPTIVPTIQTDIANRRLAVTLSNKSAAAINGQLVARLLTWDGSYITDIVQPVALPAGASATAYVAIPPVTDTSYQALDARDGYIARVGLLSGSGAQLLGETRATADFRAPLSVSVAVDEVRSLVRPFTAPDDSILSQRMGLPISSYAYGPGQTVHATITLSNGCRNIAPLAQAADETQPDNPSLICINDEAVLGSLAPLDGVVAYGAWHGLPDVENDLRFTFPQPVNITAVTLIGSPSNTRGWRLNPGAATIEVDGKVVATVADLDPLFAAGNGLAQITLPDTTGTVVRVRLPWTKAMSTGETRIAPTLGEIQITGSDPGTGVSATGSLVVSATDALTGKATVLQTTQETVPAGSEKLEAVSFPMSTDPSAQYIVLKASFLTASAEAPLLAIDPKHQLQPLSNLSPATHANMGFIVTRGFRNGAEFGAGTSEAPGNWETADDLIYAYENRLKQTSSHAHTEAGRLYVTDADFRHYSTPWTSFTSGEGYFDVATPTFVKNMKKNRDWAASPIVSMGFGDRWDTGPSLNNLYNWQDFIGFDEFLRKNGQSGLTPGTRDQIADQIDSKFLHQWTSWQMGRYASALKTMRTAFAAEGKTLIISGQGTPIVPTDNEAEIALTIRGMSDDSTWGMGNESVPFTTGRQMAYLAYNPVWQMSTLFQWGWNSGILGNAHWHSPVGTTEPSRRHYYDRAWRGLIAMDGTYRSMHTFGYGRNGGYAYTMNANDWQQMWYALERHSLLAPEAPLGVGVVLGTSRFNDPQHAEFSGGGMGGSSLDANVSDVANVVRRMQDGGISVPFSTNAATLANWKGSAPLLLLNLSEFSDTEIGAVRAAITRGARVAAFSGAGTLPKSAAVLFGVTADGVPTSGQSAGKWRGKPVVLTNSTILMLGSYSTLESEDLNVLGPILKQGLDLPITFAAGTSGYGFKMEGRSYIEVEDWLETGRTVSIRLKADPKAQSARACELNENHSVPVTREGNDWVMTFPIKPADANVICVEEQL